MVDGKLGATARIILDAFVLTINKCATSRDNRLSYLLTSEVMALLEASESELADLILEVQDLGGRNAHVRKINQAAADVLAGLQAVDPPLENKSLQIIQRMLLHIGSTLGVNGATLLDFMNDDDVRIDGTFADYKRSIANRIPLIARAKEEIHRQKMIERANADIEDDGLFGEE